MKLLALIILLVSCRTPAQKATGPRLDELLEKVKLYIALAEETKDADGWILPGDCDGLLHNSLAYLGGLVNYADLKRAENSPGEWFRTPKKDCLSTGRSKSTVSRDMLLGLILAAVNEGDTQTLKDLRQYAKDHDYVMGDHDGSIDGRWRVVFTPTMYALLSDSIDYTEGVSLRLQAYQVDYTDHLSGIQYYLASRIRGGAAVTSVEKIKFLSESDPNNAFYAALRGRYDRDLEGAQNQAINVLLREDLFPAKRLPESKDRCVPYLWMHGEKDGDWTPCPDRDLVHPGHDLLFAAHVLYYNTAED